MAIINLPVEVMDENCAGCQCMDLDKTSYYAGDEQVGVYYSCTKIHMCQYIRNRIVRNDERMKNREENTNG